MIFTQSNHILAGLANVLPMTFLFRPTMLTHKSGLNRQVVLYTSRSVPTVVGLTYGSCTGGVHDLDRATYSSAVSDLSSLLEPALPSQRSCIVN